jgi:urease accessory protein
MRLREPLLPAHTGCGISLEQVTMLRIEKMAAHGLSPEMAPQLVLPFDLRQKSRQLATLSTGAEVGLFLPRGTVLKDGDVLEGEGQTLIKVVAAQESVLLVRGNSSHDLIRAAYHLGNRHTRIEVGAGSLKLAFDPVLRDMLLGLGLNVTEAFLPFEPEPGAYGGGHRHGHAETFEEDYAVAQKVYREHDRESQTHRHGETVGNPHPHEDP